jgi:hypothetical protein
MLISKWGPHQFDNFLGLKVSTSFLKYFCKRTLRYLKIE